MIPRTFHRIWLDEPEREQFISWRERLVELHPGWRVMDWHSSSELTWLRNQALFDELIQTDPYGRVPDLLRYELLWRFGGVYVDTDVEPLRSFDALLDTDDVVVGWENDQTLCTAVLAAPPAHPVIDELITGLPERCERFADEPANRATGPDYATELLVGRDGVTLLPPVAFFPMPWAQTPQPALFYPEESYAVHHWAGGWL